MSESNTDIVNTWMGRVPLSHGLASEPCPEVGRILVTGATGYIGGRLVPDLLERGYQVRVMVRAPSSELAERWPDAEVVVADALKIDSLHEALDGVHTAYYLIHSLLLGQKMFEAADTLAARNFRAVAEVCGVSRIVYLGGLGDRSAAVSPHLRSRMEVAGELAAGKVPVTILRAAIIIGSGSASYEIIEHLVKNCTIMPVPHWARSNRCQPISVRDVIRYLVGCLEMEATTGKSYDIGGPDVLTYVDMLRVIANVYGQRRFFPPSLIANTTLFGYLASLFTPVPARITVCLMEGLKDEVVCQDHEIKKVIPIEPLSYRESLLRAMSREEQDAVRTRWSDAYPPAHELALKLHELKDPVRFESAHSLTTRKDPSSLFRSICRIGGEEGWFHTNWMWRLRGMLDRILMGVGTARGRRSLSTLRVNDVIDFWRVEELEPNRSLLLRAEMKLPGLAWLRFTIDSDGDESRLTVTAHYQPRGVFGVPYWYALVPFHHFIFRDLIHQIDERS